MNLKNMGINQMYGKAIRAQHEPELLNYKKDKIFRILENDQICYRYDADSQDDYHRALAEVQEETTDPVFDFLKARFNINLDVWTTIQIH